AFNAVLRRGKGLGHAAMLWTSILFPAYRTEQVDLLRNALNLTSWCTTSNTGIRKLTPKNWRVFLRSGVLASLMSTRLMGSSEFHPQQREAFSLLVQSSKR